MSALEQYSSGGGRAPSTIADLLERVLDKGVVVAGDIVVNVLDLELLTLKVRLLIASADTAKSMGIDWWESDPFLSSNAREAERGLDGGSQDQVGELGRRLDRIEEMLAKLALGEGQGTPRDG